MDRNDPPELTSPNVTVIDEIPERDTLLYVFETFDQDGDNVTCEVVGGNDNLAWVDGVVGGDTYVVPGFRVATNSCDLFRASHIDFERGPTHYDLVVNMYDGTDFTEIILDVTIADVNEPALFDAPVVRVDTAVRAVPGTPTGSVYDIVPPVDPEGSHNFTYSILSGDPEGTFGIGGPNNDVVVVVSAAGPQADRTPYNLTVGATDDGEPPQTGILHLVLDVQETRILTPPPEGGVCFHEQPCPIVWRAAEGNKAEDFLINFADNGTLYRTPLAFAREHPLVLEEPGGLVYTYVWLPAPDLEPGTQYTVAVSNPPATTAKSTGTTGLIDLRYPFLFRTGPWGDCILQPGVDCGQGTQQRAILCEDVRTKEFRPENPIPLNASSPLYVDVSNCGPYGELPPQRQPCFVNCTDVENNIYITGPYGPCSEPCGGGIQFRDVICVTPQVGVERVFFREAGRCAVLLVC